MGCDDNKRVVLDSYDAGARVDMERCFELLADDVVWTSIGNTRFSGRFVGERALTADLFGRLKAGISSEIERLTAEGDIVVAQTNGTAERLDGTSYNNTYCQVIELRHGKIAAVKEHFDTALVDAEFGSN